MLLKFFILWRFFDYLTKNWLPSGYFFSDFSTAKKQILVSFFSIVFCGLVKYVDIYILCAQS